jgi:6-phospho-beta-glucosidase
LVRQHAPNALPLLLTSPGSLLVRLASLEWANWPVYGICELPYTTLRNVCAVTGVPTEEITFSYTGVNHLGFLHTIKHRTIDVVEQYANDLRIPFRDIVRNWRAVPLKYLRLHFERALVVLEQRTLGIRGSRAYALAALQRDAMSTFQTGDAETIRKTLALRNADWYTEAVGPFIAATAGSGVARPFFLSCAEDGEVQERAFGITRGIVSSLPCCEAPAAVSDLTRRFIAYERAAALAITSLNRDAMTEALRLHPWLESSEDAEEIANEILGGAGVTEMEELRV